MVDFLKALELTLHNEGGYSKIKEDKGGETYCGISKVYNPEWLGWKIINNITNKYKDVFKINEMIKNNPVIREEVENFYYDNYWEKNNLEDLENQKLANFVFDFCVNSGQAIMIIQRVLKIKDDNICGKETIKALNEFVDKKGDAGINELVNARIEYVTKLAGFDTFGKGWINRIKRYLIT